MKKIFYLSLIIISNFCLSQNLSINYIVKKDNLSQDFILDITTNKSVFYSSEYCGKMDKDINNYTIIEKNINNNVILKHDHVEDVNVFIKEDDKLDWKILSETKMIDKTKLFKATTTYKNIKWIAWYNPAIPINDGPFIFKGLPGLIYEIQSTVLSINLTGINKTLQSCVKIPKNEKKISDEAYKKYNEELLQILKDGYRNKTDTFDNLTLQSLIETSIKKDLFRELN